MKTSEQKVAEMTGACLRCNGTGLDKTHPKVTRPCETCHFTGKVPKHPELRIKCTGCFDPTCPNYREDYKYAQMSSCHGLGYTISDRLEDWLDACKQIGLYILPGSSLVGMKHEERIEAIARALLAAGEEKL